jgi:NADH-quinone oxidoreductase subunit L
MMALSILVVASGLGVGWWLYGRRPMVRPEEVDPLELIQPGVFGLLRQKFLVDELYEATVVRWTAHGARVWQWIEIVVMEGIVGAISYLVLAVAWLNRFFDDYAINPGFDAGCRALRDSGGIVGRLHDGRIQNYLRVLGVAFAALLLLLTWGCAG